MDFLSQYGLFFAETATILIALLIVVAILSSAAERSKAEKGRVEIRNLNERFKLYSRLLRATTLPKAEFKKWHKQEKKDKTESPKKRLFVLDFQGDIRASKVDSLREEINAILTVATSEDEVLMRLESPGGVVHSYGLAASQLMRLRQKGISLTIAVDKVAASGGYLMACVANRIIAAPFAIVGSIGVVAQLPNFNRLLKKHDIDFEQITAGEYKRTLSVFGENTEKGREKFKQDIEDIHGSFKNFIEENRPQVELDKVATGEYWLASKGLDLQLIDEIKTSDDYIMEKSLDHQCFELSFVIKKNISERMGAFAHKFYEKWFLRQGPF